MESTKNQLNDRRRFEFEFSFGKIFDFRFDRIFIRRRNLR